ncbi:conserved hypothetical protein [Tenacibaculum sp. 190524A02b]|uniref:DUF3566 domain-containing protein n=1 Tax=Tenacibaculum vairaonense TaxID=3137860 RepID=A0ABM9PPL9_9FLAO
MNTLKLTLKKIDPVKYAIIIGIVMALMSFIMLGFVTLFGGLLGAMGATNDLGPIASIVGGGIFALILFPIIYFIFGFIFGLIGTMLLNFILKKTGGLDIEFEKKGIDISKIGEE